MPFDAASSDPPPSAPLRRRRAEPLSLGVFNHDGVWKVYSQFERAAAYADRDLALSAAQVRALEAARRGQRVELFIQEEDGELRQAAVELH
jgi:hypothetical protein